MALTATLVESTANRLRYLLENTSPPTTTLTIAHATLLADLATDPSGPLRKIIRAGLDGIGTVAAGALTQAQARDILLSDGSGASVGGNAVPRAICKVTPRTSGTTTVAPWAIDVNVDGSANPVINIATNAVAEYGGAAYLDIHVRHSYNL